MLPKESNPKQKLFSNKGSGLKAVPDKGLSEENTELHSLRRHEGRFMQAILMTRR